MFAGHSADELENLSNSAGVRARSSSGQHAIDAWESEGGGLRGIHDGRDLGRTALADNAGWRANQPHKGTPKDGAARALTSTLADDDEEDRILRFLGAAVILRWSTIPRKLQRELFDNASSMGELLQADALKGRIARFLHRHKHDAGQARALAGQLVRTIYSSPLRHQERRARACQALRDPVNLKGIF